MSDSSIDLPRLLTSALRLKHLVPAQPRDIAGRSVTVDSVAALTSALANASPATTILLADGHYQTSDELLLATPGVTLRSASGLRENVVLDGMGRFGQPPANTPVLRYTEEPDYSASTAPILLIHRPQRAPYDLAVLVGVGVISVGL